MNKCAYNHIMKHRIKMPTNLTIEPELKRKAERIAFQQSMSLSQLVSKLLEEYCDAHTEAHQLQNA